MITKLNENQIFVFGSNLAGYTIKQLENILPKLPDNVVKTWKGDN